MGFADELADVVRKPKGPQCTAGKAAAKMTEQDRAEFEAALRAEGVTYQQVAEVLARRGFDVGQHVLSRHARRLCKCPPLEQAA